MATLLLFLELAVVVAMIYLGAKVGRPRRYIPWGLLWAFLRLSCWLSSRP